MPENRTKKLEAGITKIGEKRGTYEGEDVILSIYYGNLALPPLKKGLFHFPIPKYEDMLFNFLNSPQGLDYIFPTDLERINAMILMADKEADILKAVRGEKTETVEAEKAETEMVQTEMCEPEEKPVPEEKAEQKSIVSEPSEKMTKTVYRGMQKIFEDEPEQTPSSDEELINRIALLDKGGHEEEIVDEPMQKVVETIDVAKLAAQQQEKAEPSDLIAKLKKKTIVQTILIAIQFVCIVALIILLLNKG